MNATGKLIVPDCSFITGMIYLLCFVCICVLQAPVTIETTPDTSTTSEIIPKVEIKEV